MKPSTVLFLAIVVSATSFAAGWMIRSGGGGHTEGRSSSTSPSLVSREEYDRVNADLKREVARTRQLELDLEAARTPQPPEPPGGCGAEEAAPLDRKAPRFVYGPLEDALRAMDWETIGESLHAMPPLLDQLADALLNGKEMPASVGEIQRWNGPLVTQALTAQRAGVPGTSVNGAFTHPALVANMIYAALQKSPLPLSEEQVQTLDTLGRRFADEDARRLAAYPAGTLELRKVIDECDLKDRFFAEVDGILTGAQRDLLRPAGARGYMGMDLFSSGLVWATLARPRPFPDLPQLESMVASEIRRKYGVAETSLPVVQELVRSAVQALGEEYLAVTTAQSGGMRMIPIARVRPAAKVALALREALLQRIPLDDAHRTIVMADTEVVVPYLNP